MSSRNKKISEKRYAEDRRQFKRDEPKKDIRANAEQELRQYFDEQKFSNEDLIQAYPQFMSLLNAKLQAWPGKNMHMSFFGRISSKSI